MTVLAPTLARLLLLLTSLAEFSVLADLQDDSPPAELVLRTRGVTG